MAAGPVGVKHPAKKFYTLAAVCFFLAWLLSLIALPIPWSNKDVEVGERWEIGLWENCDRFTDRPRSQTLCRENDVDQVGDVTGGDDKCRGYFVITQVMAIAGCVFSFLGLLLAVLIMGKLWAKPTYLALYATLIGMLAFGTLLCAFIFWIVYAEQTCQTGSSRWPIESYSWGWICDVVATFFAFLGWLLFYLGLYSILRFKPFIPHEEPPMYPQMDAPMYPNTAPMYPGAPMGTYPYA